MARVFTGLTSLVTALCMTGCAATLALDAKLQCMAEPEPPTPGRTRGEFPFRVVYRENGVEKTITDTKICELKRLGCNVSGRQTSWHEALKSGRTQIPLASFSSDGYVEQFSVSSYTCSTLMKDATFRREEKNPIYVVDSVRFRDGKKVDTSGAVYATWSLASHGIKIISYEQWSLDEVKDL